MVMVFREGPLEVPRLIIYIPLDRVCKVRAFSEDTVIAELLVTRNR